MYKQSFIIETIDGKIEEIFLEMNNEELFFVDNALIRDKFKIGKRDTGLLF